MPSWSYDDLPSDPIRWAQGEAAERRAAADYERKRREGIQLGPLLLIPLAAVVACVAWSFVMGAG